MTIPADAQHLRVDHTGQSKGSLYLSDLDNEGNRRQGRQVTVYVPEGGSIRLPLEDDVLHSYHHGAIRGFIDEGLLEARITGGALYNRVVNGCEVSDGGGATLTELDIAMSAGSILIDDVQLKMTGYNFNPIGSWTGSKIDRSDAEPLSEDGKSYIVAVTLNVGTGGHSDGENAMVLCVFGEEADDGSEQPPTDEQIAYVVDEYKGVTGNTPAIVIGYMKVSRAGGVVTQIPNPDPNLTALHRFGQPVI